MQNKEENNKKEFEVPKMLQADTYQLAGVEHCHEVKECDPYPMRT